MPLTPKMKIFCRKTSTHSYKNCTQSSLGLFFAFAHCSIWSIKMIKYDVISQEAAFLKNASEVNTFLLCPVYDVVTDKEQILTLQQQNSLHFQV